MRTFVKLSLAAAAAVLALGSAGLQTASAADMPTPQAQMQPPPPDYYGPPPVGYAYPPPPPVAYGYARPRFAGPYYYGRGPYWRGYGLRYAYGYRPWRRYYWR